VDSGKWSGAKIATFRPLGNLFHVAAREPAVSAAGQKERPPRHDAVLRSTPETVLWGEIAADRAPVLKIEPGQTVRIDTVSHQGLTAGRDPVEVFAAGGIAPDEILHATR
jgi:hypothetical protein